MTKTGGFHLVMAGALGVIGTGRHPRDEGLAGAVTLVVCIAWILQP